MEKYNWPARPLTHSLLPSYPSVHNQDSLQATVSISQSDGVRMPHSKSQDGHCHSQELSIPWGVRVDSLKLSTSSVSISLSLVASLLVIGCYGYEKNTQQKHLKEGRVCSGSQLKDTVQDGVVQYHVRGSLRQPFPLSRQ